MRLIIGLMVAELAFGAKSDIDVRIVDRKDASVDVTQTIPAKSRTESKASAPCGDGVLGAICSGGVRSASIETTSTPAQTRTYNFKGETLIMLLPDGRTVIATCSDKGRDCRIPPTDKLKAEFSGDNAKLKWPISIDGKKFQSESYKILSIIEKPATP